MGSVFLSEVSFCSQVPAAPGSFMTDSMSISLPSSVCSEQCCSPVSAADDSRAQTDVDLQRPGSTALTVAEVELPPDVSGDEGADSDVLEDCCESDSDAPCLLDEGELDSDPECADPPVNVDRPQEGQRVKVPSPAVASDLNPKVDGYQDIAEVYSPARMLPLAWLLGLCGNLSDLATGWDFRDPRNRQLVLELLGRLQILFCIVCPPCRAFSELQRLWNFRRLPVERVRAIMDEGLEYLSHAMQIAEAQVSAGRFFVFEHPYRASSWATPVVQRVLALPKVGVVTIDLCYFGLVSKVHQKPVRKRTKIMTNSPYLMQELKGCMCPRTHEHQVLQGAEGGVSCTAWAQIYPPQFCRVLAAAAKKHADDAVQP